MQLFCAVVAFSLIRLWLLPLSGSSLKPGGSLLSLQLLLAVVGRDSPINAQPSLTPLVKWLTALRSGRLLPDPPLAPATLRVITQARWIASIPPVAPCYGRKTFSNKHTQPSLTPLVKWLTALCSGRLKLLPDPPLAPATLMVTTQARWISAITLLAPCCGRKRFSNKSISY